MNSLCKKRTLYPLKINTLLSEVYNPRKIFVYEKNSDILQERAMAAVNVLEVFLNRYLLIPLNNN